MGSSSSEHGSISPDSDAQPDAFFEKAQVPKHQLGHLLRYCQCPLSLCRVLVVLQYQNTCWVGFLSGSRAVKETLPSASAPFILWLSPFFFSPLPLHASPFSFPLPLPPPCSLLIYPPFGPLSPCSPPPRIPWRESRRGEGILTSCPPTSFFSGVSPRAEYATLPRQKQELLNVFVCSVPDESSALEDRNTALSPEERDPGLFLLRKDSERRAILYRILWEEQNQVASNLQECVVQVQAEGRGSDNRDNRVACTLALSHSSNDYCTYFPIPFPFLTKENTKKTPLKGKFSAYCSASWNWWGGAAL